MCGLEWKSGGRVVIAQLAPVQHSMAGITGGRRRPGSVGIGVACLAASIRKAESPRRLRRRGDMAIQTGHGQVRADQRIIAGIFTVASQREGGGRKTIDPVAGLAVDGIELGPVNILVAIDAAIMGKRRSGGAFTMARGTDQAGMASTQGIAGRVVIEAAFPQ